ncbi:zinc-binding alcohol dehydrogenase family protein [Acidianus sp. HS-5]|uniref:zinc-binding alcohol dehydrogenase family protein n=1 Tax=Acidianus sp. HS-5 TaxID=2886040 RepID=UPI001F33AE2E|nr:zinc-binding alcohol dehydrogenase family protein [Acidianus sp. HS-5]BDC19056.1 alcohol dehydrogenase [Acidianus sp. HS-5]
MISIIFNQGIIPKDVVERPINNDFVLVSPDKVLLTFIENSIYLGLLWVRPWTTLGSIGIGKIEAVGVDVDPTLQGKNVVVLPYSRKYGGIGTEIDGLLTEKAVVPDDAIVALPEKFDDKALLYPFISIASQIVELAKGEKVLIIGSGLLGLLTYQYLLDNSVDVSLYTDIPGKKIQGVKEVKNLEEGKWDIVVLSTMRGWARYIAERLIIEDGRIIVPAFMNTWPPTLPPKSVRIYPKKMDNILQKTEKISDKFFNENIAYSDDVLSSIPTSKNGIIVNVKKALSSYVNSSLIT